MGNCWSCFKKTFCYEDDVQSDRTLQQPSPSGEQQPVRCEDDVQSASTLQQPSPSGEQQPTMEELSTSGKQQPTMEECIQCFNDGKDKWDIDALISCINDFLNDILNDNLLGTSEGAKILSEILQKLGNIHWIAGGLSILGYLLTKFRQVSASKTECLELIKCMVDLVNQVKKLNIQMPEEEKRLRDALLLILQGCIMCASQIQSGKFFRFLKTSVNSEILKDLRSKIIRLYLDLTLTGVIGIQPQLSLTQPTYPAWAVGLEEPVNQITEMLEIRKLKDGAEVMVIYGFGGIGKTTLAHAVLVNIKLEGFNFTKIIIDEDPHKNDFTSMQQQLLKDVFPEYQHGRKITLRHCEEGRDHLTQAFQSEPNKPLFIFIDNVLRAEVLKELLPKDLRVLSQRTRILVTARDLSVTDLFEERGLSRRDYRVNTLADEHARKILCNDPIKLEQIKDEVKRFLQICGGIPLALKIVGAQLRKQKYRADNCREVLQALEKGEEIKQEYLSEWLVNFVYKRLETSAQEAFLDICTVLYVKNFGRRDIEHIVGVNQVAALEEAALITAVPFANSFDDIRKKGIYWEGEEELIVHYVILAKGRSMAKGTRIVNDSQSLFRVVEDQKVLQSIKVVGFDYDDECEYMLEESQLSCMSNSLRVFRLGHRMSVRGSSSNTFQELRYLNIGGDIPCLPVNLEALPRLAVYVGPIFKEGFSVNKLPKSLRYLESRAQSNRDEYATSEESNPIQTFQNSWLQEINLSELKNVPILLEGIHQFIELKILWMTGWDEMKELPAQVCQLRSLNKLIMRHWKSLKRLPESFSTLTSLTHLNLGFCLRLEGLCLSFGELRGLRYLTLRSCKMLTKLPYSFGQLVALEYLDLSRCTRLTVLPNNFGQLTTLKYLNLSYCKRLKELPLCLGEVRSLRELDLSYCYGLKELLFDFVQLRNLQVLKVYGREELPLSLEQLRSLKILG